MKFSVERVPSVDRDVADIFNFLVESYRSFGDDEEAVLARAADRVRKIEAAMPSLGNPPHQETKRENLSPGVRSVTKDRAIYYFSVNDTKRVVRVLAVFFGGQDHSRRMLKRLLGG
jgi:toxin ParE1/3/4